MRKCEKCGAKTNIRSFVKVTEEDMRIEKFIFTCPECKHNKIGPTVEVNLLEEKLPLRTVALDIVTGRYGLGPDWRSAIYRYGYSLKEVKPHIRALLAVDDE